MTSTLDFTEEQDLLRETVRRFLTERAPITYVREMYDDPRGTTDNMWQDLVGLGLTGILVPEDCGGLGLGLSDMGVVLEEMGRALHPGPFLSSAVAATLAVRASGSGLDQSAVLTGLASGEQLATLALFEPAQRYEWRTPITSARQGLDGRWTVTGTKVHVPDAAAADLLLISAKAPDGLGLFVVEASTASIQPDVVLDGTRKQATVVLNESPATRLGQGDLTSALAGMVDRVAVAYVVDAVGAGAAALEMCVSYAKDRVAFGRPIGSFQAVQHLCVAMYEKLELSRAAAYRGLWSDDAGEDELHRVALIAKTYASDALVALANDAIQIHGGIGTTWEHNIHLFYKRCVSMQAAYGSSLEHADALATFLID